MTYITSSILTLEEEVLRQQLQDGCMQIQILCRQMASNGTKEIIDELTPIAHRLHVLLKKRGKIPVHNKWMLQNRGVSPDDKEFYRHLHPIEDLLDFINNCHANDDPIDTTMGHTFELHVYTNRWGHPDFYRFTKTEGGWNFSFLTHQGECEPDGSPYFYQSLEHDFVDYPSSIKGRLHDIWDKAHHEGWNDEQVQEAFDMLGFWLEQTQKSLFNPFLPQEASCVTGCIAMFDVLGWKAIQATKPNALEEYLAFATAIKRRLLHDRRDQPNFVIRTDLHIVSDTIFLHAACEHSKMYQCLNQFAEIGKNIIVVGINHGFFMRGAISYGDFQLNLGSAVFIGNALDDVASQYENGNWIGCHLSPNIPCIGIGAEGLNDFWVRYNDCPLKNASLNSIYVVDFLKELHDEDKERITNALIVERVRHGNNPCISKKYENTLRFIDV